MFVSFSTKRAQSLLSLVNNLSARRITSKCVRIHEFGSPDVLTVENIEIADIKSQLKDGDILIKNDFAGLNFIDTYQRSGLYKVPLPSTLGVDGAGVVEEITAKAEQECNLQKGDRVAYYDLGSYSQYKILAASKAIPIPNNVPSDLAVGTVVQGMTAHYLSMSTFALRREHTCVVHAAAGGVGQLLVQVAKHVVGSRVIATASSAAKRQLAVDLGADYCVDYADINQCVQEVTDGQGVDVVYDGVGKDTYLTSMALLRPRGLCILYGNASGAVPDINPLVLTQMGSIYITRPTLVHYTLDGEELNWRASDLFSWLSDDRIKIKIDQVFTLDDAAKAHQYIQDGKTKGKVVFDCQR